MTSRCRLTRVVRVVKGVRGVHVHKGGGVKEKKRPAGEVEEVKFDLSHLHHQSDAQRRNHRQTDLSIRH